MERKTTEVIGLKLMETKFHVEDIEHLPVKNVQVQVQVEMMPVGVMEIVFGKIMSVNQIPHLLEVKPYGMTTFIIDG